MKKLFLLLFFLGYGIYGIQAQDFKYKKSRKKDYIVQITTDLGSIDLILFDQTPIHKENFLTLASKNFYDSLTFHRVLEGFVVQGGDPNSYQGNEQRLGSGGPGYELTAEIDTTLFLHERGAIGAARMPDNINPERKSSGSQFYIVQGQEGAHHLDGEYTVFGEVIKGMEVVDLIAQQEVDRRGNPLKPIRMNVTVVRLKKKDIRKRYDYTYPEKRRDK
ncbi:peptidylprolyl isomerase [Algivirga pacifica]|uniref:Peptidyl-prolyl cis-trans isomerase n=1 Tax=Algivirga pacifica TaxID=1162670 RepID=A0ABP9D9G5_9BACT